MGRRVGSVLSRPKTGHSYPLPQRKRKFYYESYILILILVAGSSSSLSSPIRGLGEAECFRFLASLGFSVQALQRWQ